MKTVVVLSITLLLSGVALGGIPKNVKRGLNHGERQQPSNSQSSLLESFPQFERQSSQQENPPLPTPGIPPSLLSFSAPEGRGNVPEQQQRTAPFLDEDRNSVIQDSAAAPPSPPQFDTSNVQQGDTSVTQAGPAQNGASETVLSTGQHPPEGTVIGAPYLIAIHRNIIRRYGIPVARPYPVQVPREVRVPIDNPVPYKVDRPYAVRVNVPQPYAVDQPYAVPVDRPYPVQVPHPVGIPVPQPYPVRVPHPVPVAVPTPVAVRTPVPVPHPVPVAAPVPVAVAQPAPYALPHAAPLGFAHPPPLHPAPLPFAQAAPFHFAHSAPFNAAPLGHIR